MSHVPRLFCLTCNHEMLIHKNGVRLEVVGRSIGPYYKIRTDVYRCPKCLIQISYQHPLTEPYIFHHNEGFNEQITDRTVYLNS